jgi:glycerol-3-phosphate dehydrogenase
VSRLSRLEEEPFDVVVVGGGIIGCGIARDAALRGLRVALIEKRDFGSGTTAASTRIVHGGLRYLEMLDFRLVRLDLRERETLLRIAPHLVRPLEFLIPFFRGDGTSALKLRAGLAMYDALSYDKNLPSRRWLPAVDARGADRALTRDDVRGAAAYYDARVDSPERLALENVVDAEQHGAVAVNYCAAISTTVEHGRVSGVRVRDEIDGNQASVAARAVVNATGAWFERVAAALTARQPHRIRTTKGIHIVCPPLTDRALVLFSRVDRRLLFAIPRRGLTWIGTTDTDFDGDPADARATREDVAYLLDSVHAVFPALDRRDVLYTTAGVRALVRRGGSASSVSRMHKIVEGEPVGPTGMISVLGGKITGYRAIAEEATDLVCQRIGRRDSRATTADAVLPGARPPASSQAAGAVHPDVTASLYDLYGTRAEDVMAMVRTSTELGRPLSPLYPDIGAQVVFGVRHEHCLHLSDFLRRRTLLGATADQGWDAAAPAAALMATELRWSVGRMAEEIAAYRRDIEATQQFRTDS